MNFVTVEKEKLHKKLYENREKHKGIFLEAQTNYRKRVIEELDRRLMDARSGKRINLAFSFPEPEDHTKDYDKVIKMVEMEVNDNIELDSSSFSAYVMDDWHWRRAWINNTVSYTQH